MECTARKYLAALGTNLPLYHLPPGSPAVPPEAKEIRDALFKMPALGSLGGAVVWCLPLAQGVILETLDRIPHRAPGAWSLLLPLPMSLPLSLCV